MTSRQLLFRPDTPADRSLLRFGDFRYLVYLHESVPDDAPVDLRRRLGLVLQHLAAHGRTSVVKGCAGENRGWRRSPLGGRGGMQYYLWWTLHDGTILARAVRHHDNHALLSAGDVNSDYYQLYQSDFDGSDESFVSAPWTEEQLRFVNDTAPVRVVYGHPGSGKTTALWRAVETRRNQRVLYVSWSRDLTGLAKERFAAFAPDDVTVVEYDFITLLSAICGYDIPRPTYAQSRAAFTDALAHTRLGRADLGPWAGREDALYSELRAILLGRAIPGESGTTRNSENFWRLSDANYLRMSTSRGGIGQAAADALLMVASALEQRSLLTNVFPELAAAADAIRRLRRNEIPNGLSNFDRIAVDEIQDLTLIEIAVIVELYRAVSRQNDYAPHLLAAGDEGQTVRPTGFEWGRLNEMLAERLSGPQQFILDTTLRSPQRIAQVIEKVSDWYVAAGLKREQRPGSQQHQSGGEPFDAQLFYVDAPDVDAAIGLLEQLNTMDDLAVITPENDAPQWLPGHLLDMVLTRPSSRD